MRNLLERCQIWYCLKEGWTAVTGPAYSDDAVDGAVGDGLTPMVRVCYAACGDGIATDFEHRDDRQ